MDLEKIYNACMVRGIQQKQKEFMDFVWEKIEKHEKEAKAEQERIEKIQQKMLEEEAKKEALRK